MNILFSLYDARIAGGQRVAIRIAEALVRRGHRIGLVVPAPGPASDEFATLGATLHTIDLTNPRRPRGTVRAVRVIAGYDVLYSHTSAPGQILGGACAILARRPHVVHQHSYPDFSGRPPIRAAQLLLYRALVLRARFIAVADHVADSLTELGVRRDRIDVVPNATPLPPLDEMERPVEWSPVTVGVLGRLDRQKGIDLFIEAARRADLGDRAHFVVGGPRGPFAEYEREVEAAAAEAGVTIVEPEELGEAFLERLDVVVVPSRYEGLPLGLLESMARAKPVVATAIPGIREVLEPEEAGILVPPDDPDALARAIVRLVGDPELRAALGRRARKVVESRYALDAVLARTVAILEASVA